MKLDTLPQITVEHSAGMLHCDTLHTRPPQNLHYIMVHLPVPAPAPTPRPPITHVHVYR